MRKLGMWKNGVKMVEDEIVSEDTVSRTYWGPIRYHCYTSPHQCTLEKHAWRRERGAARGIAGGMQREFDNNVNGPNFEEWETAVLFKGIPGSRVTTKRCTRYQILLRRCQHRLARNNLARGCWDRIGQLMGG